MIKDVLMSKYHDKQHHISHNNTCIVKEVAALTNRTVSRFSLRTSSAKRHILEVHFNNITRAILQICYCAGERQLSLSLKSAHNVSYFM
jgi:hypothetical protein